MLRYNNIMKPKKQNRDEKGIVSIVVVSIIVILLALITLGFSKIMDRELRQALDRELSSQANYAAEAGLNDARAYIAAHPGTTTNNRCKQPLNGVAPFVDDGSISGSYHNDSNNKVVQYTCVIIDPQPKELVFDVDAAKATVFKTTASNLPGMYFGWENAHYDTDTPKPLLPGTPCNGSGDCQLPQEGNLDPEATGMLRVTIYPVNVGLGTSDNINAALTSAAKTYFLYPNEGSGVPGDVTGPNGSFVMGNCRKGTAPLFPTSIPRFCNSKIPLPPASQYYVFLTSVYKNLHVSVHASSDVPLPGAQSLVDVTGEGNDVLRRLQARVVNTAPLPAFAINSMDTICKRFRLEKIGPSTWSQGFVDPPNSDPACDFVGSGGGGGGGPSPPPGPPPPPSCTPAPLSRNRGDYLSTFALPHWWRADLSSPLLPTCGSYTVEVTALDPGHRFEPGKTQPQERIYVEGCSSSGGCVNEGVSPDPVFRTPLTKDIPNNRDFSDTLSFNTGVLSRQVDYILIKHIFLYPPPGNCNANGARGNDLACQGPDTNNSVHGYEIDIKPN